MKWAARIEDALACDGFELLAQPIVPIAGQGPVQYELLLRMRDGQGGLIPPGSFLNVAERLGLIRKIDRWVARRAIDILAEHRARGHDLRLEVNLSGHTLGDEHLLELVKSRFRETGVPPDRLTFEVTETAAVADIAWASAPSPSSSHAGQIVELLALLGVDYGQGFHFGRPAPLSEHLAALDAGGRRGDAERLAQWRR